MDCFIKKSVCTLNETGGINAGRDYYPYGETLREYNNGLVNEKYKYNEKEQDVETGFLYYGKRYLDPALTIWLQVDPLSFLHPDKSPYNYCMNNPLIYRDLMGLDTLYFWDQKNRPSDNGTQGTSYTATIIVIVNGKIVHTYKNGGSTYPNSKSNSDNATESNTVNEGEYSYNNLYGHKAGTKKGLNIVNENGEREVPGTTPEGESITMEYVNIHEGASNNGNYNSRGSEGCLTINPSISNEFFNNFNWSSGNTGSSTGVVNVTRGDRLTLPMDNIKAKPVELIK